MGGADRAQIVTNVRKNRNLSAGDFAGYPD